VRVLKVHKDLSVLRVWPVLKVPRDHLALKVLLVLKVNPVLRGRLQLLL
jgi:hypothetical protein